MKSLESKVGIQSAMGHISAILKGVLFIGISIQTVLGIVWMCCNFPNLPQFGESLFYAQVSRILRCDEYTGILYPVFLWVVRRNHSMVYGIQLVAAYAAARRFLHTLLPLGKWQTVWGCLAVLTIPTVMQCHMAMLPCSFAASLMLLELSLLAEAIKEEGKCTLKQLAALSLCWLALALLLPEYLYLGAVPVLFFILCGCRRRKGRKGMRGSGLLVAAAFLGMILGVNSLTQAEGLYGRIHRTPLMTLTQRVAWPSLLEEYEGWHGELAGCVERETIIGSALYADEMDNFFFSAVEQAVAEQAITPEQAEGWYKTVAEAAWTWHKPAILKEILWDVLGYSVSPVCIQMLLEGRGYDSYTNRNYDFFLEHTPKLSKLYMDYGGWWFAVMLALTAALLPLQLSGGDRQGKKAAVKLALCCLVTAGIMALWYTLRGAGMMDYKYTAVAAQLWAACPVMFLGRGVGTMQSGERGGEPVR